MYGINDDAFVTMKSEECTFLKDTLILSKPVCFKGTLNSFVTFSTSSETFESLSFSVDKHGNLLHTRHEQNAHSHQEYQG